MKFEGLDKLPQMGGHGALKAGTSWGAVKAFNLLEIHRPDQKLMTLDLGPSVRGPRYSPHPGHRAPTAAVPIFALVGVRVGRWWCGAASSDLRRRVLRA